MATPLLIRDPGSNKTEQIVPQAAALTMEYVNNGNVFFIVFNGGGVSIDVTVSSAPESRFGRDVDIVQAITAGENGIFGPFATDGFNQTSGADKGKVLFAISAITAVDVVGYRARRYS